MTERRNNGDAFQREIFKEDLHFSEDREREECATGCNLTTEDDVDDAVEMMRDHAVRRLPVVENGRVVGVVSLGDLALERDPDSALGEISSAPPNR